MKSRIGCKIFTRLTESYITEFLTTNKFNSQNKKAAVYKAIIFLVAWSGIVVNYAKKKTRKNWKFSIKKSLRKH